MNIKFNLDLNVDDLIKGLKSKLNQALALTFSESVDEARNLASSKLGQSGLSHWEKGFEAHRVSDDIYVISINGQLASWMEEGIDTGEISKAVMSGNRASHNKADGKNYVDVPFFKDADYAGNIKGTNINVKAFADADSMVKSIKFSDFKNKSIREEKRVISRVQDIIKSTETKSAKTQYLTIRRVTDDSVWPSTPFEGAGVLDNLDQFVDSKFGEILERTM